MDLTAGLEPATSPPLLSRVSTISVANGGSIRLSYVRGTPLLSPSRYALPRVWWAPR